MWVSVFLWPLFLQNCPVVIISIGRRLIILHFWKFGKDVFSASNRVNTHRYNSQYYKIMKGWELKGKHETKIYLEKNLFSEDLFKFKNKHKRLNVSCIPTNYKHSVYCMIHLSCEMTTCLWYWWEFSHRGRFLKWGMGIFKTSSMCGSFWKPANLECGNFTMLS